MVSSQDSDAKHNSLAEIKQRFLLSVSITSEPNEANRYNSIELLGFTKG
jgi:hypothetical protein